MDSLHVDFSPVPTLVGAALFSPRNLALGVLLAYVCDYGLRRGPAIRALFNTSNAILGACAASAVFSALDGTSTPKSLWMWLAVLAGDYALEIVTGLGALAVMSVTGAPLGRAYLRQMGIQTAVLPLITSELAVVALSCYFTVPLALVALAIPCFGLAWWYSSSEKLRNRFRDLQSLYQYSQSLSDASEREDILTIALRETTRVLHCQRAELCLSGPEGLVRFRLGESGRLSEQLTQWEGAERLVLETQEPVRFTHSERNEYLIDRRLKDAMITPLTVGGSRSAVLVVANRDGSEATSFEREDLGFFQALAAHLGTALTASEHLDHLRRSVAEREHQAYHDALTGLANRTLFMNVVAKALEHGGGTRMVAVVLMDLDGFKEINDALGHHTGDEVLKVVAQRVSTGVREYGLAARLGGDEFAFMVGAAASVDEVLSITEKLMASVGAPMDIGNVALTVRASVGIALAPVHGLDAPTLLKKADVAMYSAKSSSRRISVYDRSMDNSSARRLALATDLGKAIEHDELDLWFQPVADMASGRVAGFEALLRWPHPALGFIPPDEFIPIAEQTGLIEPLTWWVVNQALSELRRWRDDGFEFDMAINFSARSLLDPAMVDHLRAMVSSFDLTPSAITLEITESSMMVELERSEAVLRRLSDMGFRIAIDDFGTGYSSLSRLKVLPVHVLKIDRAFVKNITFDKGDQAIVKSIIELARVMDHQIVAEGIEDLQTWSRLASLGCDLAQGYYFARPMLARDCRRWVLERQGPNLAPVRSLNLRVVDGG